MFLDLVLMVVLDLGDTLLQDLVIEVVAEPLLSEEGETLMAEITMAIMEGILILTGLITQGLLFLDLTT